MKQLITTLGVFMIHNIPFAQLSKKLEKNGMHVNWHYKENRIHFKISAPTKGWMTIGFNNSNKITGAY